jgi:transcriptional regulator with XRE-family HTH domain
MRAKELRSLRLQKCLTQAQVAAKYKVSQPYYSTIERGEKPKEIAAAAQIVNGMRKRNNRTAGGERKAGRQK